MRMCSSTIAHPTLLRTSAGTHPTAPDSNTTPRTSPREADRAYRASNLGADPIAKLCSRSCRFGNSPSRSSLSPGHGTRCGGSGESVCRVLWSGGGGGGLDGRRGLRSRFDGGVRGGGGGGGLRFGGGWGPGLGTGALLGRGGGWAMASSLFARVTSGVTARSRSVM